MEIVEGDTDQQLELMTCSKKEVLKGVKVDKVEWRRRHLKGKDIQVPPADHQKLCQHLKDYKDKERPNPLLCKTGKEAKQANAPTMMKTQLRCHYHQQCRAIPFTN